MNRIKIVIAVFICAVSCAQVGVNTTSPTNTLDVNGGARVRNLTEGTIQSDSQGNIFSVPYKVYAFAVADKQGNILKQFGIASITNLGGGKYRFYFTNQMIDNDYIILAMGKNRTLTYDGVTDEYFEVTVSSTSGQFDFNILIIDLI